MNQKVLILSTSPRPSSNSDALADAFARGAQEAGHQVEKLLLRTRSIGFCKGCLACQRTQRCVLQDDMAEILDKMRAADVIAFATPIYFYGMCGQMKTLLDRSNPLFPVPYAFRSIYLLCAAAEEEDSAAEGAAAGLQGWIDCFPKARLAGTAFAGGVTEAGDIHNHPALKKAYALGAGI